VELAAQSAVARNPGHFEAAAEAVATDLEALAVRQHVAGVLREYIEPHRPALSQSSRRGCLQLRGQEIRASRVGREVIGVQAGAESVQSVAHLQAGGVLHAAGA